LAAGDWLFAAGTQMTQIFEIYTDLISRDFLVLGFGGWFCRVFLLLRHCELDPQSFQKLSHYRRKHKDENFSPHLIINFHMSTP
jgi:hypothetical protein